MSKILTGVRQITFLVFLTALDLAQGQTINSVVKLTDLSQKKYFYGTVVEDSSLPGEAFIVTVRHGKKEICSGQNQQFLVHFQNESTILNCEDYVIEKNENGIDAGFIFSSQLNTLKLKNNSLSSSRMWAFIANEKNQTPVMSYCPDVDEKAKMAWAVFDNRFVQVVSPYFHGCSGSPLFNQNHQLIGVLNGFALESNRTRYEPITKEFVHILAEKVKRNSEALKNPQPLLLAKGPGGASSDGTNELLSKGIVMAVEPNQILKNNDLSTYYMLQVPQKASLNTSELDWLTGFNFNEDYPLVSCTFNFESSKQEKYKKIPIDLQLFNSLKKNPSFAQSIGVRSQAVTHLASSEIHFDVSFGSHLGDELFSLTADSFKVSYQNGKLVIDDKLLKDRLEFKDPNGCYRVVKINIPNSKLSIVYNISFATLYRAIKERTPYFDVFIKRAILNENHQVQDYLYLERMFEARDEGT